MGGGGWGGIAEIRKTWGDNQYYQEMNYLKTFFLWFCFFLLLLLLLFILNFILFYFFYFIILYWRRKWQPTPVFLPGESHGWRSLVGCSPCGRTELDTTEATQQKQQYCIGFAIYQNDFYTEFCNQVGQILYHWASKLIYVRLQLILSVI